MFHMGQPITIKSDDEWNGVRGIVERVFSSGTLSVRVESQEERIAVEPWETEEYATLVAQQTPPRPRIQEKLCDCGHYSAHPMTSSRGIACPDCYDRMSE